MKTLLIIVVATTLFSCHQSLVPPTKTGLEGKALPAFNLLLADSITTFRTIDIPQGRSIVVLFVDPGSEISKAELSDLMENNEIFSQNRFYICSGGPFKAFKDLYYRFHLEGYRNIVAGLNAEGYALPHADETLSISTAIFDQHKILQKAFCGKVSALQLKEELGEN